RLRCAARSPRLSATVAAGTLLPVIMSNAAKQLRRVGYRKRRCSWGVAPLGTWYRTGIGREGKEVRIETVRALGAKAMGKFSPGMRSNVDLKMLPIPLIVANFLARGTNG